MNNKGRSMPVLLLIIACLLAGCASMTDTQKKVAWTVVGGVVLTSAVMALDDDASPRPPCLSHIYRSDWGTWVCTEPGFYP